MFWCKYDEAGGYVDVKDQSELDTLLDKSENAGKGNPNRDPKTGKYTTGKGGDKIVSAGDDEPYVDFSTYDDEGTHEYIERVHKVEYTDTQKGAINSYKGGGYDDVNYMHRHPEWKEEIDQFRADLKANPNEMNKGIKQLNIDRFDRAVADSNVLDFAINKTSLPENTMLYRGALFESKPEVGQIIPDRGFGSTSYMLDKPEQLFYNNASKVNTVMTIKAKKGQSGIPVQKAMKGYDVEHEFILPRNTKYKITKVTETDDGYLVEATI